MREPVCVAGSPHKRRLAELLAQLIGRAAFRHKDYIAASEIRSRLLGHPEIIFGDCDIPVAPSALGGAPEGPAATGYPAMNVVWSGLGTPTLTIPVGLSSRGLPFGLQLIARPGQDERLLAAALWAERRLER